MKTDTAYLAIKCIVSGFNVKELTKEQEIDIKKVLDTVAVANYEQGRCDGFVDGMTEGLLKGKDSMGMIEGILQGVRGCGGIESRTNTDKEEGT